MPWGGILDLRDRWGFDGNLSCLGKDLCGKREGQEIGGAGLALVSDALAMKC